MSDVVLVAAISTIPPTITAILAYVKFSRMQRKRARIVDDQLKAIYTITDGRLTQALSQIELLQRLLADVLNDTNKHRGSSSDSNAA
ncbi:MAG TPA: hypothetical protein VI231_22260 [Candidatus Binatia bacterium]|jgi:hypothetical protein